MYKYSPKPQIFANIYSTSISMDSEQQSSTILKRSLTFKGHIKV